MSCPRRPVRFDYIGDVLTEVDRLAASPYQRAGQWNLVQIATHLAGAFELSLDGFGTPPPSLPRVLVGKIILRVILLTRRIPTGRPLAQKFAPAADTDPAAAIARLRTAIDRLHSTTRLHRALAHLETPSAPLATHPFFGRMSPNTWTAFHLVHCAHHLSFLTPASEIAQAPTEKTI
jgi:hypothetical protein